MRKILLIGMMCLIVNIAFSQEQDLLKQYNLDEVVVSATRTNTQLKNIPQKVEIIDVDVLQSFPVSNMGDVLKSSTNLDIIQYPGLSSSIGMRGFSPSAHSRRYALLLMNDKPMGATNISCLDMDIVVRTTMRTAERRLFTLNQRIPCREVYSKIYQLFV
jgi:vitamin B12 transporter